VSATLLGLIADQPHPEALATMRERGGTWAAYGNVAMDSVDCGQLQFIRYGDGCTFQLPPKRCPDTQHGLGWKYQLAGTVDLASGKVVPYDGELQ
jgi:hypothetical protein